MRRFLVFILLIASIHVSNAQTETVTKNGVKYTVHYVKSGESLYAISKKYNVSVANIKSWNKLKSDGLDVNQKLLIKKGTANTQAKASKTKHIVKAGESLYKISKKYNVSVSQIKAWNKLSSDNIDVGQTLYINGNKPATSNTNRNVVATTNKSTGVHTVKSGESLYVIGQKYGVTVTALKKFNGLTSTNLSIGQKLKIPAKTYTPKQNTTVIKQPKIEVPEKTVVKKTTEAVKIGKISEESYHGKYAYCFHKTAQVGTIIKLTNPKNGMNIYARVMGKSYVSQLQVNEKVINSLAATYQDEVQITYYQ